MSQARAKSDEHDVLLLAVPGGPAPVAKAIAERFGVDLTTAEEMVSRAPLTVKKGVPRKEADAMARALRDAGAHAQVVASRPAPKAPSAKASSSPLPKASPAANPSGTPRRWLLPAAIFVVSIGIVLYWWVPSRAGLRAHSVGGTNPEALHVVLLHGYGAPGDDLVPLARQLHDAQSAEVCFLIPEGPVSVRSGFGHAWWDARGRPPDGFEEALAQAHALVDDLIAEGTPPTRIVVGGFSQGGQLASAVALTHEPAIGGAAIMSAGLVPGFEPEIAETETSFFISHGEQDAIVPFRGSRDLAEALDSAGNDVEWVPFVGVHTIPPAVRESLTQFVSRLAAESQ